MKHKLIEERDRLIRQREALDNQIMGLERAIALVSNDADIVSNDMRKRRPIKHLVLDLLDEVGTHGLNANTAVSLANTRGATLDKNSVSSLLSRLKADNVVIFDGDRYRLSQYAQLSEDGNSPKPSWLKAVG